jgi:DNA-binding response OmpR family regulator
MNLPITLNRASSRLSSLAGNQRCDTQRVRILMVDDDVSLCHVMQVILEKEGFALATEHTMASGLRRVVEDRFAIVLLDVVLPDGGCDVREKPKSRDLWPVSGMNEADQARG